MNMLHRGHHAQEALDSPRFCVSPPLADNTDDAATIAEAKGEVFLEEGITVCPTHSSLEKEN